MAFDDAHRRRHHRTRARFHHVRHGFHDGIVVVQCYLGGMHAPGRLGLGGEHQHQMVRGETGFNAAAIQRRPAG